MAFFDFLRRFSFFRGRNTEGLREEDVDFQKWINAHREWRRRLTGYIDGTSEETLDENVVCRDDRCDLGKWINGNGTKFYAELPVFQQMRRNHSEFHVSAGQVVKVYKASGRQAARKMLHADFDLCSLRVVVGLESLERQVKQ
ncbi:MAG: CZB domain-containing protein [Betaproteobacteria bacterium]|nr:CZB domain-containing protein [Betaproteobacteria bacterium]